MGLVGCEKRAIPEQDIVAFVKHYVDAGNKADLNELRALYSHNPKSMSVDSGYLNESLIMLKGWESSLETIKIQQLSIGMVQVINLDTKHAIAFVPFTMKCALSDQSKDAFVEGLLTVLVSDTPKGLRVVHDAYSYKKQCE